MRSKEIVICGLKAVRSRFENASETVIRLFFTRGIAPAIGDICRWMAQERLVYRCVEPQELELISGTVHHGEIVVVVEPPEYRSPPLDEVRGWARANQHLLLLDRISNVHNLGAIIRTAAFFGISKFVLQNHSQSALPTEATFRVAEGGMDHIEIFRVASLAGFIHAIRPIYTVIGAATSGGSPQIQFGDDRAKALVMGNEEQGLDPEVAAACSGLVTIPGSGRVESLNVSAAASVLMWEMVRSNSRAPQSSRRHHVRD